MEPTKEQLETIEAIREPVRLLFKKLTEEQDPLKKKEINQEIEDIIFPLMDEMILYQSKKDWDNWAEFKDE